MEKSDILLLYDYNDWANERILRKVEQVTPEQFLGHAPSSFGSLRGTLVHTLWAEVIWRQRCQEGISPIDRWNEHDFLTVQSLLSRWGEEKKRLHSYLDSLKDPDLYLPVRYTNTKGVQYETVLWQILVHVVNHGTQFRSEAGMILTSYDRSPGDLDFIQYLRETA